MNMPIYYNLASGRILRWTVPADDKEAAIIEANIRPHPGEGVLMINAKSRGDEFVMQALVSQATGIVPIEKRYAYVDANGDVQGATFAYEPAPLDGLTMIEAVEATGGWKLQEDGTFIDLNPVVPPKVINRGG